MTKVLSLRLDDEVAALVEERAKRTGRSLNQVIQDSIREAAAHDHDEFMALVRSGAEKYRTVMERLA